MNTPPSDYEVGYRKPPQHTRFQKGQSGNPSGRAKTPDTLPDLLLRALNKNTAAAENGERRTTTKWQAVADQLVDKAVAGDLRAFREVVKLVPELVPKLPPGPEVIVTEGPVEV